MMLPQAPQVFWQRLVTKPFFPQYFLYLLHFEDISLHSESEVGLLVFDGASVVSPAIKNV